MSVQTHNTTHFADKLVKGLTYTRAKHGSMHVKVLHLELFSGLADRYLIRSMKTLNDSE